MKNPVKKFLLAALVLTLAAVLALPALAAPLVIETYKAKPVVDGYKDAVYENTPTYPINNFTAGSTGNTTGAINMLWDGNTLYFYIESYDTTPWTGEITEAYLCDCVELFLDLNNQRGDNFNYEDASYIQIRFNNAGEITGNNTGDQWILQPEVTDNVKCAIGYLNGKDLSDGYAVEVSFDVSKFTTLSEGKEIAFDIQLADVQGDNTVRAVQAFLGNTETALLDTQWNTPVNCGAAIVLKGPLPEPPAPETEAPQTADVAQTPVVKSPQTADFALYMAITAFASSLGLVYFKKQKKI